MKANLSSTHKKVVVHKLDKELVKGYVKSNAFLGPADVELLDREGRLVSIPIGEIKGIYFVREFESNPQRPDRKVFHSRPRMSGLWIRMTFKDDEVLEGLISKNLLDQDSQGFLVTPPDMYSNNLKVFVPRSALSELEVLGVILHDAARRTYPHARQSRRKAVDTSRQIDLFSPAGQSEAE